MTEQRQPNSELRAWTEIVCTALLMAAEKGRSETESVHDVLRDFAASIQEKARQQIEELKRDFRQQLIEKTAKSQQWAIEAGEAQGIAERLREQLAEARAQIDSHVCDVSDAGALEESIAKARWQAFREAAAKAREKAANWERLIASGAYLNRPSQKEAAEIRADEARDIAAALERAAEEGKIDSK